MMITPYIFIDISCIFLLTILFIGIHTTGNDDRSEMIYRRTRSLKMYFISKSLSNS